MNNLVNAQEPNISAHPASASYRQGATPSPLTVAAASPDGGTISYQWLSEGSAIQGATAASYSPPTTTTGTLYYSATVTNSHPENSTTITGTKTATAASNAATIAVKVSMQN